jgi:hypothetical protein
LLRRERGVQASEQQQLEGKRDEVERCDRDEHDMKRGK